MVVNQSPVWLPVSRGLSASYSLNFSADANQFIPLTSLWQGDAVQAKSLYINNYSSAYSITITNGSFSAVCPAYSAGYVDIRGFGQVLLTAEAGASATVTANALNYVESYGFTTRTFQNSSTSDSLFSRVKTLQHFENFNGAGTFLDSKTGSVISAASGWSISTANDKFGSSSLTSNGSNLNGNNVTITAFTVNNTFAIEMFFNANSEAVSKDRILCFMLNGASYAYAIGFTIGPTGITRVFVGHGNNVSPMVKDIDVALSTPATINQWHYVALSSLAGSAALYFDGVLIGTVNSIGAGGGTTFVIGAGIPLNASSATMPEINGYIDELRVTDYARYLSSAPVPSQAFFDQ